MVYEYTFDDYKKVQKIKNTVEVKRDTCLHSAFVRIAQKNTLSTDNDLLGYKTGDTVIISFETVLGILDDWARENELLAHGIIPSASEDKCVLGMPLDEPVPEHQTDAISRMLEDNIKPRYVKELKLKLNIPQYPYKGKGRLEFD